MLAAGCDYFKRSFRWWGIRSKLYNIVKDLKLLRSFGPTALVRRLVPAPGLDG